VLIAFLLIPYCFCFNVAITSFSNRLCMIYILNNTQKQIITEMPLFHVSVSGSGHAYSYPDKNRTSRKCFGYSCLPYSHIRVHKQRPDINDSVSHFIRIQTAYGHHLARLGVSKTLSWLLFKDAISVSWHPYN